MIRRLRRRHLIFGTTVLALAPLGLILGVTSRPGEALPLALPPQLPAASLTLVPGLPVELGAVARRADSVALVARATTSLQSPDPLLYWSPAPPANDSLPEGAVFIGPLSRRASIATFARTRFESGGTLLIVDGARRRIVKTAPAPADLGEGPR